MDNQDFIEEVKGLYVSWRAGAPPVANSSDLIKRFSQNLEWQIRTLPASVNAPLLLPRRALAGAVYQDGTRAGMSQTQRVP